MDRAHCKNTQFEPQEQHAWHAKWIWDASDGREKNAWKRFRREFTIDQVPDTAELRITADTRYAVWINGTFVRRGPVLSQPYHQYYDVTDVAPYLEPGANCIAVLVWHIGHFPDTRGGLLAELSLGESMVTTDASWKVQPAADWRRDTFFFHFNKAVPYQEVRDTRREPVGWDRTGFDDSTWSPATVLRGRFGDAPPGVPPWTRLVRRDIPDMHIESRLPEKVQTVEECTSIDYRLRPLDLSPGLSTAGVPIRFSTVKNADNLTRPHGTTVLMCSTNHLDHVFDGVYDPCLTLDFGRIITAYLELDVEGPPGAAIDVGFAERLTDGRFVNSIEGQFAGRFILRGGRQTLRTFNWLGFRFLRLRVRHCWEPLTIHACRAVVTTYPYEERGAFDCDDERLNRIWSISRYTIRLCSNEFLTDTPWREQGQWLGDVAAVTLGGIYACFGDTALPGKFLRQSAANQLQTGFITNMTNTVSFGWQTVHPDYSLWWIQAVWNHYLYTGDPEWVHRLYPVALKCILANLDYMDEGGLINRMPYFIFIDWAGIDRRGRCAPYNAILYGTLEVAARMAEFKGDQWTHDLCHEARRRIRAAFTDAFLDPDTGCLVDAEIDGVRSEKISEHTNMLAVLYDLVEKDRAAHIIRRLYEDRSVPYTRAEPFFTWQVLKALDHAGRFDLALSIVRERWGWMLDRGASSVSEEWGIHGSWRAGEVYGTFMRTESHAWSACPAEFLTRVLIGLEILEPGFRRIRLAPRAEGLQCYRVVYPTPRGLITVKRDGAEVRWTVPPGVEVEA